MSAQEGRTGNKCRVQLPGFSHRITLPRSSLLILKRKDFGHPGVTRLSAVCHIPSRSVTSSHLFIKKQRVKMSLEALFGAELQGKEGKVAVSTLGGDDCVVGIYFSAHWCPPCKSFTPLLVSWYKELKGDGAKLEIVFVSSDRDDASFNGYYGEMPWLVVPFEDREKKADLCGQFGVSGIPMLVFVDGTGKLITKDGRTKVMGGASFSEIK